MQIYHKLRLSKIRNIYYFFYVSVSLALYDWKLHHHWTCYAYYFQVMEKSFIDQLSFHCWRETADSNKTATFQQFFDCKEPVLLSSFLVVLRVCGLVFSFHSDIVRDERRRPPGVVMSSVVQKCHGASNFLKSLVTAVSNLLYIFFCGTGPRLIKPRN